MVKVLTGTSKSGRWQRGYVSLPGRPSILVFEAGDNLYDEDSDDRDVDARRDLNALFRKWAPDVFINVDGREPWGRAKLQRNTKTGAYTITEPNGRTVVDVDVDPVNLRITRAATAPELEPLDLHNTADSASSAALWAGPGRSLLYAPQAAVDKSMRKGELNIHRLRTLAMDSSAAARGRLERQIATVHGAAYHEALLLDTTMGGPEEWETFSKIATAIAEAPTDAKIAVHCSAGLGRSGLVLALYYCVFGDQCTLDRTAQWLVAHHKLPYEAIGKLKGGYHTMFAKLAASSRGFAPLPGSAFRAGFVDLATAHSTQNNGRRRNASVRRNRDPAAHALHSDGRRRQAHGTNTAL
jgi:hypothetical protein